MEMHAPKVTIGMPVYNGERFIQEALDSLLAQTFTDFELIISDNASTDATEAYCREYAGRDERIRYVRQSNNLGAVANFYIVLEKASGAYFMWAAADDKWDKDFLKIIYEAIVADKNNIVAFCPYISIDENSRVIGGIRSYDYSGSLIGRLYKFIWHYDDGFIYGLFKKDAAKNIKISVWWWCNSRMYDNVVYPPLFYILSSGCFAFAGSSPLWFNRVHNYKQYRGVVNYKNKILLYFMFCLRKINLFWESLRNIYSGSRSFFIVIVCFPVLAARCIYDCFFLIKKVMTNYLYEY